MKLIFKIASAFMLLACSSIALKAQTKSDVQSWESAKKQALAEHKLIFVDLYFTGCKPCAEMDATVFPDPKVATILQSGFITFKSDVLKEEIGKILSMKYGVGGFPTLLFVNPDGRILDIAAGFQSVDQFSALLKKAKESADNGIFKKYDAQILEKDYPEFYRQAYLAGKRNVPFEVVDAYLKSQPSLLAEIPFVIITGLKIGKQYNEFFLKNVKTLSKDYGRSSVNFHVFNILMQKKKEFAKTNDLTGLQKIMDEVKPIFGAEEWTRYEGILLKDFGTVKTANNPYSLNK